MKRTIVAIVSLALVAGCATIDHGYRPVIDTAGVNQAQLDRDLVECRQFAKERLDAANGAVAGAVAGAVLTVALVAILGGSGRDLSRAAGAGALGGGVGGAAGAERDQRQIVAACLQQRGYRVLGL